MQGISDMKVKLAAAAVALALSATIGFAQQSQPGAGQSGQQAQQEGAGQSRSGAQQQSGQSGAQQQSGQRASQQQGQASSQQRQGDSPLDSVVQQHAEIGTFVEALEQAGLVEELTGGTEYTIFAPTNQAFESMQQEVAELLKPENREELVSLLRNHIVADDVDPQMARQLQAAQTLDGDTIEISTEGETLMIGEASVVTPNIEVEGANLRIYSIDQVLGEGQQVASGASSRERG